MKYRTKVIINGAELPDEQKDNATSITGVSVTGSCGNGFQIGSTASSMLEFTVIKPYKESFDGDKVDFYVLPMENEEEESRTDALEAEVGDREETEHIEDTDDENDVDTEETEDTDEEAEDVTEAEEAESEAEMDALELDLYDMMNGESTEDGEGTEEETVPEGDGWDILGTFYVFKQQNNNDGTVTLQCFDGFQLMNDPYIPAQKNGTFQQFYDDIRAQCQAKGIIVDEETFEAELNPVLEWNQDCTLREAIGYLAGLQGGFATFGDDNTLGISYFGYNDEVLLTSELLSRTTTSAGETMVDGIVCTVNLKQDTIEAGEGGQSLYMYNPFMTQELLDNIFSQYRGIRYTGAVLQARWDTSLVPGEFVRIMTDSEYMNYVAMNNALANSAGKTAEDILNLKKEINAVGKSILVSTQKITFGGETTVEIRSHLMTETEKANAPLSPSDAKFRVVTADLIRTKELIAQKAEIEDLKATNALIKNLQAVDATITGKVTAAEANIESVKADYVKASEFDVKTATIAKAEIGKATIKDAQLESINGNKIEDGSIVAAALSKEVIKNFNNSNVYYQAEAPEGTELKEGDIWYKTLTKASGDRAGVIFVYDGIEWVNKPFDSESILAGSITAAEIAANTITASQINMENLQTNMARIGEATKNHVLITEKDVQIRNGQKVVASYGKTSIIGDLNSNNIVITSDGISLNDGGFISATIEATKYTGETLQDRELFWGNIADSHVRLGETWTVTYDMAGNIGSVESVVLNGYSGDTLTIPFSLAGPYGYLRSGNSIKIHLDGTFSETTAIDWTSYITVTIVYTKKKYTAGTITCDETHIIDCYTEMVEAADRMLVGKRYDLVRVHNVRKMFVIGNGDPNKKSNAAAIMQNGDIRLKGTVYFGCREDSSGGKTIVDLIYPVGSIYMSVNGTDPGTLIGGTWERIKDKFLLSAGDTYAAGSTGGSAKATLPAHAHTVGSNDYQLWGAKKGAGSTEPGNQISGDAKYYAAVKGNSTANYKWLGSVDSTGASDVSQANMPPYLAVYVWKRIS